MPAALKPAVQAIPDIAWLPAPKKTAQKSYRFCLKVQKTAFMMIRSLYLNAAFQGIKEENQ